jgi:hypothetical protein
MLIVSLTRFKRLILSTNFERGKAIGARTRGGLPTRVGLAVVKARALSRVRSGSRLGRVRVRLGRLR